MVKKFQGTTLGTDNQLLQSQIRILLHKLFELILKASEGMNLR